LSPETSWTITSETFIVIDTFWSTWNNAIIIGTIERFAIMGFRGTLVDVITSYTTIKTIHASALPVWSLASTFITASCIEAISIDIAHIDISTFVNVGADGAVTIVIAVTNIASTAESTTAHSVSGYTTNPLHGIGLGFISTNRSTCVAVIAVVSTFIVVDACTVGQME